MRVLFPLAVAVALSWPATAQQPKLVGNWLITIEKDRFTGDPTAIAVTTQGGGVLALRCMQGALTFAVRDGNTAGSLSPGELFVVKFKGGAHDVMSTMADAINDSLIEIVVTPIMRQVLLNSDEFAFRFSGQTQQFDSVFKAGTASRSLAPVLDACPSKTE